MSWPEWVRGAEIEPSLYAADFLYLGDQIEALLAAGARVFHVDVGDGKFIPPVTIGPVVVQAIAPLIHDAGGRLDCHLMVADPEDHFEQIAAAGGDSVTFHLEVCDDVQGAIDHAHRVGLAAGLAINPDTPVEAAADASSGADLVLCMSVHPGYSGQAFLPESLDRLRRLRGLVGGRRHPLLQVDGGIGAGNARAAHEAGADLLVAGSSIFRDDDIAAAYVRLASAVS
jgi:ribulose-phosphate 3-epimerase